MQRLIYISVALLLSTGISAQVVLDRVLLGAGSQSFAGSSIILTASVGEPIVTTVQNGNLILTQGFQQSNYVLSNPFILDLTAKDAACIGANDGNVGIAFISDNITEPRSYLWSDGSTTPSIAQAAVGTYSLTVTGANGNVVTTSIRVSPIDSVDCAPIFYIGITPNNDNSNDYWHIDNAEFFTQKDVQIFNRYGALVWEEANYDNTSARFDGNHSNGNTLPDGTYYYIAKFDDSIYRGWIEITR